MENLFFLTQQQRELGENF